MVRFNCKLIFIWKEECQGCQSACIYLEWIQNGRPKNVRLNQKKKKKLQYELL